MKNKNSKSLEITINNENVNVNENVIVNVDPIVEPIIENEEVEPVVEPVENNEEPTVEPMVEPTVEPMVEPMVEPTVEPMVEPTEEDEESKDENEENNDENIKGAKITKCTRLNVRKEANKNAEVVCVITKDSAVTVNIAESTEDFYKVYTSNKEVLVEGYCMKEFINID